MNKASIWRQSEYVKFFTSFFIGNIGDWFDLFALQLIFAHRFNASANDIVNMLGVYILPMILLASTAGSFADKFNKKWLLLITDIIAGCFTVALIFAPSMNAALILIGVRSCVIAFNAPAQQVTSKLLLPDALQLQAASYEKVAFQLCRIIGPMLGAVVVAATGASACLAINAGSFFVSAAILALLKPIHSVLSADGEKEASTSKAKQSNMKLTLNLIKSSSLLRYLVPIVLIASMFIMTVELQLVILLRDIIPTRPNLLGYVIGFSAIGSLLSAVWLSRKKVIRQFGWYMVLCFICAAVGYTFMGLYRVSWPVISFFAASMLSGFGLGIVFVLLTYALKIEIPADKMGRVSGIMSIIQGVAYVIGVAFGGDLISRIGARDAFFSVGLACFVLGLVTVTLVNKMRVSRDS